MKSEAIRKLSLLAVLIVLAGCHKKVAQAPLPPAPQPEVAKAPPPPPEPPPKREEPKVVEAPPAPPPEVKVTMDELLAKIQDVYFDYDKHAIRSDAQSTLQADAIALREIFKQFPGAKLTIQGFCDERGSDEYNLALGDERAKAARDFLVTLGLPGDQLLTVSFGKEKPICTEHTEDCWQKNRRAHMSGPGST